MVYGKPEMMVCKINMYPVWTCRIEPFPKNKPRFPLLEQAFALAMRVRPSLFQSRDPAQTGGFCTKKGSELDLVRQADTHIPEREVLIDLVFSLFALFVTVFPCCTLF